MISIAPAGLLALAALPLAATQEPVQPDPSVAYLTAPAPLRIAEREFPLSLVRIGPEGRRTALWDAEPVDWLFVRGEGTQRNIDAVQTSGPEGKVTLVPVDPRHLALVGADLEPRDLELDAAHARAFLHACFPDGEIPASWTEVLERDPVRLRRIECSKLLVRSETDGPLPAPSAVAQSKTGQRVEIRPLADPTVAGVGGDLPFRMYDTRPSAELRALTAYHAESGARGQITFDGKGFGFLRLHAAGRWVVEAHFAGLDGDVIEIESATLSFTTLEARIEPDIEPETEEPR